MPTLADLAAGLVAAVHTLFAVVEVAFPRAIRIPGVADLSSPEGAQAIPVARNAGVYNAFLAVALWAAVLLPDAPPAVRTYLLGCAAVAGAVGGLTLKWTVFVIQAVPALVALGLWLGR